MTLVDLLRSPWAIEPTRLEEIQAIYATHLRGEKIDIEAIEARLGRPLANEQQAYTVREGGVAVLSISGAISAKANLFTQISGGASAQLLTKQVQSMMDDPRVRAAVIDIDSPGGSVFGIPELAGAIKALSGEKPTVAVSTGMMASAGYWIGSAANAVYASGSTDLIGSIGVVMTHSYDPRGTTQKTEITAGKYKRMATDSKPLDAEGRAYLQGQVDHLYSVFAETVAENRRVSVEDVLANMADGRVFIGSQAKAAGLIDGIATVDTLVERLATNPEKFANRRKAVFALGALPAAGAAAELEDPQALDEPVLPVATQPQPAEVHMTPQELADKFKAENPAAHALILAAGATAEQSRIAAVREQLIPGHEALIEQLAADGKTTGAEAAMAVLAAERGSRQAAATARLADAPPPVKTEATAEVEQKAATKGDLMQNPQALDKAAREYMAANKGVSYLAAVRAVTEMEA
jgi:signal peptide peptidase SppA